MTYQPPPPPPGMPPAYNPPGGPGGQSGFDAKAFNPLDWGIVGAGVLTFLLSFIDFYSGADISEGGHSATVDTPGYSAWHSVFGGGFFSWFAMLFALAGAVLVAIALFAPQVALPVPGRLAGLGLFAAATLFEIVGIFVTPGADVGASLGGLSESVSVSLNHGFGFWASLIVIIVGLVLSLMRFQATGGQLPGNMGSKVPNLGGYGPQGGISGGSNSPRPNPGPYDNPPPPPPPTA